jgi:hypothetical protein
MFSVGKPAFIGYIGTRLQSEIIPAQPPVIDPAHVEQAARIHEDGGFDRALGPEPEQANRKERIGRRIRTQRTNRGIDVLRSMGRLS